jgi:F0F1-type ATP synthase membrane subunit b/b'
MLPLFYNFLTITASFTIIIFVLFYAIRLHAKEKALEAKRQKVDTDYHKIVDDALAKERKILDDAASEADKIITDAKYVSSGSKDVVDKAMQKMITDIQKESVDTGRVVLNNYTASLKELTNISLKDIGEISKGLDVELQTQLKEFESIRGKLAEDLQEQMKTFNETQVAAVQKELDAYKEERMKQTEQMVLAIAQKVSQDVLNKSIALEDHEKLVIDSFEKAKKIGLFDS